MPQVNTRIQHKHDTYANWNTNKSFVPLEGELVVYTDGQTGGSTVPAVKIGDGTKTVEQLEFISGNDPELDSHVSDSTIHVTAANKTSWNAMMPKSGGTFTGMVTLKGAPTSNLHAATKAYVDSKVSSAGGGNYEKHSWVKTGYPIPSSTVTWSTVTGTTLGMVGAVSGTLQVADSYTVNSNSEIVLTNPRTFSWTNYGGSNYGVVTDSEGTITTFPALFTYLQTTRTRPYYFNGYAGSMKRYFKVTSSTTFNPVTTQPYSLTIGTSYEQSFVNTTWDESKVGEQEIIYTSSASSYTEGPDGNGYTYSYLGIPSDTYPVKFPQRGSYIGTGTGCTIYSGTLASDYVESAPAVSITFDYVPDRVTIYQAGTEKATFIISELPTGAFTTSAYPAAGLYMCMRGTTLYWKYFYNTDAHSAEEIWNKSGTTYTWEAI